MHSFGVNSHNCEADVSLLCQYMYVPVTKSNVGEPQVFDIQFIYYFHPGRFLCTSLTPYLRNSIFMSRVSALTGDIIVEEIGHDIICMATLSIPLIQVWQLSICGNLEV